VIATLSRAPGLLALLLLMLVGFGLGSSRFASVANLTNVAMQASLLLLIALPMTFVIMTEGLDLSIGAVLSLASVVLAIVAVQTGSFLLALLAGIGVGVAVGALNGVLVAWLAIPPFVATLGTLGIAQGLALLVSDGQSITDVPASIAFCYDGHLLGVPVPLLILVITYLVMHALLYRTAFGTYIFALGGNREALALAGVNWRFYLLLVYGLAGAMAGLAGLLMAGRLNAGHPTAGIGMEFDAIAAVAVGGTAFERGNGWLPGTLLGVFAIGLLRNGLNLLAVNSSLQVCCVGLLVIFAFASEAVRR
jgi:ribose transport system permease protein